MRRADGTHELPYMSGGLDAAFGIRGEDVARDAQVFFRLMPPEDFHRFGSATDYSLRSGRPFELDCRLRTPDGGSRWLHMRGNPRRGDDGSTVWDTIGLDVTERKRVEDAIGDALHRSEARYRQLFERNFVGIFRTRADGIVLDCNDAFARLLGYATATEARGQSVIPHYATPGDRDAVIARIDAGEEIVDQEMTLRRVDGSLMPVSQSVRRVTTDDGRVAEGTIVDLTDRKRAEEAEALRAVTELAYAAAHEINNPLAVIMGQVDLALVRKQFNEDAAKRTKGAIQRITEIVGHMTHITRRVPSSQWSEALPTMLDIRKSGGEEPPRP